MEAFVCCQQRVKIVRGREFLEILAAVNASRRYKDRQTSDHGRQRSRRFYGSKIARRTTLIGRYPVRRDADEALRMIAAPRRNPKLYQTLLLCTS